MSFLSILEGISPWWWVAFAFALGSLEMATMSFFLIWPGLAALLMAGLLVTSPSVSGELQISIFAVLSVLLTFGGRHLFRNFGDGGGSDTLNRRSDQIVGRMAEVLDCANGEGAVRIDGMRWRATWTSGKSAKAGDRVRIVRADGMQLFVEPVVG